MRRALLTSAALALVLAIAVLAPAQEPAERREAGEQVEGAVSYAEPAPEMRKLAMLVGRWEGTQTWAEPRRYKRPGYEGYPGPGGHLVRVVEPGPGGFSLAWTDEGRGPMGAYTARAILSWDPERRVYELDRVHSLVPGIARFEGGLDKGSLVLRGTDPSIGEKSTVSLEMRGLSPDGWTETVAAREPVVTTVFRPAPAAKTN